MRAAHHPHPPAPPPVPVPEAYADWGADGSPPPGWGYVPVVPIGVPGNEPNVGGGGDFSGGCP